MYNQIKTVRHASKDGLIVQFTTKDVVNMGDYFQIVFDDKIRYFQVVEIIADASVPVMGNIVIVKCLNVGQHSKLANTPFDTRLLINLRINKVSQSDVLKKIREELHYC